MTVFCSGVAVQKVNLRLHPSALVLWVQSTMYLRLENENVVFLLLWDILKESCLLTYIRQSSFSL